MSREKLTIVREKPTDVQHPKCSQCHARLNKKRVAIKLVNRFGETKVRFCSEGCMNEFENRLFFPDGRHFAGVPD